MHSLLAASGDGDDNGAGLSPEEAEAARVAARTRRRFYCARTTTAEGEHGRAGRAAWVPHLPAILRTLLVLLSFLLLTPSLFP